MRLRFTIPPMVPSSLVSFVMNPYFARTLSPILASSSPVTSLAVPSAVSPPGLTRPRASHGCSVTYEVCRRRFAFPDPELVQKPSVPSPMSTIQTGVGTGVPFRR